jgi:hypothetical protein
VFQAEDRVDQIGRVVQRRRAAGHHAAHELSILASSKHPV